MTRRAPIPATAAPLLVVLVALALGATGAAQDRPPTGSPGAAEAGGQAAPQATARITGQVITADTGQPVKRATVHVLGGPPPPSAASQSGVVQVPVSGRGDPPPGMTRREATTDDSGRFEMSALPPGRYSLTVQAPASFLSPPPQIVLVADGGSASVTFALERGGAIVGRVLDHEGDPLVRARVQAMQRRSLGGRLRLTSAGSGSASTDDLGQFRLFGMPPGEYYVVASYAIPGSYIDQPAKDASPTLGFAPTFYPSAVSIDGAQTVTVRAAQETMGVEISLVQARLGSVSGRATDSRGRPLANGLGFVSLVPAGEMVMSMGGGTRHREDGTYIVSNVAPGRYYLTARVTASNPAERATGPVEAASKPIVVDGDDIVVDIQTNVGATVSGRVVIEGSTPAAGFTMSGSPQRYRARVSTRAVDLSGPQFSSGNGVNVAEDDLTFTLTGLRGTLVPTASGPGLALKSVVHGGDDILASGLSLDGTETIEGVVIAMTTDVGTIDGIVTGPTGDPAEAWIVVFPDDPSKWFPGSPFVRLTRSRPASAATSPGARGAAWPGTTGTSAVAGRAGGFLTGGLLPGRYYVAVAPVDSSLYSASNSPPPTDAESLAGLRRSATATGVAAGQTVTLELQVSK